MKQRAEEEGRAEGLAKGRAEGRAEGHAEGLQQGILNSAKNLIRSTGMSAVQALSAIGVAQENLEEYIVLLEKCISEEK
jgi:flagellar biosynthesis/type III secretory pathway protein FliH